MIGGEDFHLEAAFEDAVSGGYEPDLDDLAFDEDILDDEE